MCNKGIIWHDCSYLRHKHKLSILSCMSDFRTCCERLIFVRIQILALDHCRKIKFSIYVHQTLIGPIQKL